MTFRVRLDLQVRADFERQAGRVVEFIITLERVHADDSVVWIVRYETHGGRAHKHERWNEASDRRHIQPKHWRGSTQDIFRQALADAKERHDEYAARYDAWMKTNDDN